MKRLAPTCPLAIALVLVLGGCARGDTGRYPSLAIRDVERISGTAATVPGPAPEAAASLSGELARDVDRLVLRAQEAHGAFLRQLGSAQQAVGNGAGAPVASEGWSVAQAALSALDASRNPTLIALADLDSLYVRAEMDAGAAEDVAKARERVQALVADQEATISSLAGRISD